MLLLQFGKLWVARKRVFRQHLLEIFNRICWLLCCNRVYRSSVLLDLFRWPKWIQCILAILHKAIKLILLIIKAYVLSIDWIIILIDLRVTIHQLCLIRKLKVSEHLVLWLHYCIYVCCQLLLILFNEFLGSILAFEELIQVILVHD